MLNSNEFYTDKYEYEKWVVEKRQLLLEKFCFDKDQQTKKLLENKLIEIDMEICEYNMLNKRIKQEQSRSPGNITDGSNKALENYRRVMTQKQSYLDNSINYVNFVQEYCEVTKLLTELQKIVSSDQFGETIEEIEAQIKHYDKSYEAFIKNEPKIQKCLKTGNDLTQKENKYKDEVQSKLKQLNQSYLELKSLANERKQNLICAKGLISFQILVDDLLEWFDDLHIEFLRFDKALKRTDVASIKSNLNKFKSFCSDLETIDEKVSLLEDEADYLISLNPTTLRMLRADLIDVIVSVEDLNSEFEKRRAKLPTLPKETDEILDDVSNIEVTVNSEEHISTEKENGTTNDDLKNNSGQALNTNQADGVLDEQRNLEELTQTKKPTKDLNYTKQKTVQFSVPPPITNSLTKKPSIKVRRVHSIAEMLKNKGISFKNTELKEDATRVETPPPMIATIPKNQSFILGLRNGEKNKSDNNSSSSSISSSGKLPPPPRPPKRTTGTYTSYPITSMYSTKINNNNSAPVLQVVEHTNINSLGAPSAQINQDAAFNESHPIIGLKKENSFNNCWHIAKKTMLGVICFRKC